MWYISLINLCSSNVWLICVRVMFRSTVYPKKYAHGFVVLCFVVVMQSFIMNSHEVFIHIHQGCFAGTGAIVRLPQCQWSKPGGYGKISQCITTTKHSKAKTVCIFLGIYCMVWGYYFGTIYTVVSCYDTVGKKVFTILYVCFLLFFVRAFKFHYAGVIMGATESQITGVLIVCSTVCSDADQRKH